MKKIYPVLVFLLVLASCSEWKYTKGIKSKQTDYHASKPKEKETRNEVQATAYLDKDEPGAEENNSVSSEEMPAETGITEENTTNGSVAEDAEEITIMVRDEDDSLQTVDPEVVRMAFDAEDQGRKSRNLALIGVGLTLTYIFGLVGLILAIIGLIKGVNSLKSRYNTPKGIQMARTGVIASSIIVGLYVLAIVILLVVLFAFLL